MVLKNGRLTEGQNFLEFEVALKKQMLCSFLLSRANKKGLNF